MRNESSHWAGRMTRALVGGWHRWRERRGELAELAGADYKEVERLAHDLGLSSTELKQLAAAGPGSADLLYERCEVLGISPERLQRFPELRRDLEKNCSLCESKRECAHDLQTDPLGAHWPDYCPNEPTLAALRTEKPH